MRLRDPAHTKVIIVTLAEPTPVSEAAQLQADLRRAGIEPFAWVVNSSFAATGSRSAPWGEDGGRAGADRQVRREYADRIAIVPWMTEPPVGPKQLLALAERATT